MMETTRGPYKEAYDRLALLLITRRRSGWEQEYEQLIRHEFERLASHPRQAKHPAAGPSKRGVEDGTKAKEDSANEAILH